MRAEGKRREAEVEKLQVRGKSSRWLFPRGLCRYLCCGRRSLPVSCGAVGLPVAALTVEFRPSARTIKVAVGGFRRTIGLALKAVDVGIYSLLRCRLTWLAPKALDYGIYDLPLKRSISFPPL